MEKKKEGKPVLRVLHHFACSGGTLISKCIDSLPNTYVLSEVHPLSTIHINDKNATFRPTDLISLSHYAKLPRLNELKVDIFEQDIIQIVEHAKKFCFDIVVRFHSHSSFFPEYIKEKKDVFLGLRNKFHLKEIVTIRDPVESYISLLNNSWIDSKKESFDSYCQKYLCFLEDFDSDLIFKYEDFVLEPELEMKKICESLSLQFSLDFIDFIALSIMSGDSGRSSETISFRSPKEMPEALHDEVITSLKYKDFCEKYDY